MVENRNWSHAVTTRPPATFPPDGLHRKDARTIYLTYRAPWCSPNGLASAIQMVQFFINRAGRKFPEERKSVLREAMKYLQTELRYRNLKTRVDAVKGAVHPPKLWDDFIAAEQEWMLLEEKFPEVANEKPVHPPPSLSERIGGRNGFNGPYKPPGM